MEADFGHQITIYAFLPGLGFIYYVVGSPIYLKLDDLLIKTREIHIGNVFGQL